MTLLGNKNIRSCDVKSFLKVMPVQELCIKPRTLRVLTKNNITTVYDLIHTPMISLYKFKGLGQKTLTEVEGKRQEILKMIAAAENNLSPPFSTMFTKDIIVSLLSIFKKSLANAAIKLLMPRSAQQLDKIEHFFRGVVRDSLPQLTIEHILDKYLDVLNTREIKIIKLRKGLFTDKLYTLEEIGKVMGLSRERVRQLETVAMNKLKCYFQLRKLSLLFHILQVKLTAIGGIASVKQLEKFLSPLILFGRVVSTNAICFLLDLDPETVSLGNGVWCLKHISKEKVEHLVHLIEHTVENRETCLSVSEIRKYTEEIKMKGLSDDFLLSIVQYSEKLAVTFEGKIAFKCWNWAFPHKRRDYVEMILRLSDKPLHYIDITRNINNIILDQAKLFSEKGVLNILLRNPHKYRKTQGGTYIYRFR